ncbi:LytS/YhcK type 5TM receptor domain-containing protein [Rhizobium leguminosarum]|uniref:LytS/YhcK type 5TM receptor domain-containing protein n=1 Tax=Rhizobium leguminosarum TaxID=384 RepID=UPI00396589DA
MISPRRTEIGSFSMMGLGAVLSMILSVEIDSGYYLDLRSTLLAVSAVYCGPLAVLVTGAVTSVQRISMGGGGVEPAAKLVGAADEALYAAKKHGRDRVEAAADQARAA